MAENINNTQNTEGPETESPLLKNRYRLGRVLGRGGMCIVYQAWDTRLERNVAVKRLDPSLNEDPRTRARFDREGRALAQLSHPNLVSLIDRGTTEKEDYLVFEYIEGRSLKELVRKGRLSIEQTGSIAGQIAEGLAVAHAAGIIHRDIKPQNILIDREGHAKVNDFGIATGVDWTRVTRAGSVIGSARYMSPEQIRSKPVDARSDIYSLGVVMYEMLAGNPPFNGSSMPEIAREHLNESPPPLSTVRSDIPPGLEKIIMRCLEKIPDDRFSSMDEVLGALVGLDLHSPHRVPEVPNSNRRLRRNNKKQSTTMPLSRSKSSSRQAENSEEYSVAEERVRVREEARKKQNKQKIRLLVGLAAFIAIIVFIIILIASLGGKTAPELVGLSIEKAEATAASKGYKAVINDQIPSFDKEANVVLSQDPVAGGKVEEKTIHITVARTPQQVKVSKFEAYDPPPGDNEENTDKIKNLFDGNKDTAWTSELYSSTSFGSIPKEGVGIDFTLEAPATIIKIVSGVEGWQGQLLHNIESGSPARLQTLEGRSTQIITLGQPISTCRFWFTHLTKLEENKYGVDLRQVEFYR